MCNSLVLVPRLVDDKVVQTDELKEYPPSVSIVKLDGGQYLVQAGPGLHWATGSGSL